MIWRAIWKALFDLLQRLPTAEQRVPIRAAMRGAARNAQEAEHD